MFLGEYQHSLDAKGRVILPSRFRARLEGGCVLTKGRDGCILVYPREEWDRAARRLSEVPLSGQQARRTARVIFSGASEQTPDSQGRVTIPESLRRYAGLEREVVVAGNGTRFEMWDRDRWDRQVGDAEREYSEIADAHPDLPF